ncbi:MAG TPA: tetratricopeptide repeat protein [Vicinamibacteria bacterium]|jgi:tetratricopeptide (TPR) repeat protein
MTSTPASSRWLAVLAVALALPASAAEKKKTPAPVAQAVTAEDLVKQAEAKAAAGDADGALELLRKATAMPGAGGDAPMRLGRMLEGRNQFDEAIDAYKQAGERLTGAAKGEALARLSIAQNLRGSGEAAASADAALAADPEGLWPMLAQARRLAREGKGAEAAALAEKAAAKGGGAAAAVAVGAAQEAAGALDKAEAAYRTAAADPEQKVAGNVGLARVLRKTGRAAEAEPILAKVVEEAPGAVDAYKEGARVKMALGRTEEALGDASTAAALAENDPEAKALAQEVAVAKALIWVAKNQPDLAVQELTRIRDENPQSALPRVGLGRAYIAKKQADPALAELTKALELDPGSAEAQYQLGVLNQTLRRDAAAGVAAYEKAVAADPGNDAYKKSLGYGLIDLGGAHVGAKRYKDAVAVLERGLALAPDTAAGEAYLAWAWFGLKDSKRFVEHGAKARTLGHKEPNLLAYLSRVEKGEPIK